MYSETLISARHIPRGLTVVAPLLTAALFGALAWRIGERFDLLPFSVLAAVGVVLSLIDVIEQRLPSMIIYITTVVVGLMFAAATILQSRESDLLRAFTGMATLIAIYLAIAMLSHGGLGAGDLKLGGLLGLALGWLGWPALVTATFLGWFAAAVAWLVLRAARRRARDSLLPMGPFLLTAALVVICMTSI
jgi:leader peptidase (prepilin peptidase)/N-methyltransferase